MERTNKYIVYILGNSTKTIMFVGITLDLVTEIIKYEEDSKNNKETFPGKSNCIHLYYYEHIYDYKEAAVRQLQLKIWGYKKKENLIKTINPDFIPLNSIVKNI